MHNYNRVCFMLKNDYMKEHLKCIFLWLNKDSLISINNYTYFNSHQIQSTERHLLPIRFLCILNAPNY